MKAFFKNIFISPDEPRLRAGWRLLLHIALIFIIGAAFNFLPFSLGGGALAGQLFPVRGQSFYLEKAFVIGKNKAATSAATFTPTLYNGATAITLPSLATTVTGAVATASTAIGSTQTGDLKVTFPATTLFLDSRCVVVQGYNE